MVPCSCKPSQVPVAEQQIDGCGKTALAVSSNFLGTHINCNHFLYCKLLLAEVSDEQSGLAAFTTKSDSCTNSLTDIITVRPSGLFFACYACFNHMVFQL